MRFTLTQMQYFLQIQQTNKKKAKKRRRKLDKNVVKFYMKNCSEKANKLQDFPPIFLKFCGKNAELMNFAMQFEYQISKHGFRIAIRILFIRTTRKEGRIKYEKLVYL